MSVPLCEHCRGPLPLLARADARHCSTRCRVAAHRAAKRPPAELTASRRWVRHSTRKVPLTVAGAAASSTDPATWATYAEARRSRVGAGLGCVLTGDGIVCLDLDHCLDARGRPNALARSVLARVPDAYVEISPSGDGLHVWGTAPEQPGRMRDGIEAYSVGRYITITGNIYRPGKLVDLSEFFTA